MEHTHTAKTTRDILGNKLYQCSCGAKKWSHGKEFTSESGTYKVEDGWYIYIPDEAEEEVSRKRAIEMLQTEGHGYGKETRDLLDSHMPNID